MIAAAIVIATYDRPDHLRECLASIGRLEGGPYTVIVVDDGSPTSLSTICAEAGDNITLVRQENAGPAAARNRGVVEATGADIILFTDDDCRPNSGWAERLIAAHGGDENRLVGGMVVNGLAKNPFSSASQAILTYSYNEFADFDDRLSFFTTNNLCVSRAKFLEIGGFDENYRFASEDRDFSFRWRQAGGHLRFAPDAHVSHRHRLNATRFLRQHYSYGKGARQFHERIRTSGAESVKLGQASFYAGLLLHPMRRPSLSSLVQTFLIGVAHASMALGYFNAARRRSWMIL